MNFGVESNYTLYNYNYTLSLLLDDVILKSIQKIASVQIEIKQDLMMGMDNDAHK
jgi:hypothetical protein